MAESSVQAFIAAIQQDPALQELLSTTAAADADEVAAIAHQAGFAVKPDDLVTHASGALVEYIDEDWFLKPRWWELNN
jgi:predicted ribosomally synthesized peptide with nif11-like leader